MQIRTFTLLKVFNLLIDLLIQLIKQGKETAELIIIPRRIFQGHLIASLYKNSKTFLLTTKTSNTTKRILTSMTLP